MSEFDVDLAVVGAGPAGSSAALAAAREGLKVALFDPRSGAIDRPCGEGILPSGVEILRELGLERAFARGRAFDTLGYVIESGAELRATLGRPALALERPELALAFEAALARERGVVRSFERAAIEPLARGFAVRGTSRSLTARAAVASDGAGGSAARWLTGERERDERWGLRARFHAREPIDRVSVYLTGECELFLTPLSADRVNLAILFDALPANVRGGDALLEWALDRAPGVRALLGERASTADTCALGHRPPRRVAARGAFLAGDSGGSIDPVIGCGVSLALESGAAAADAARALAAGEDERSVSRCYTQRFRAARESRARLARLLRTLSKRPLLARTALAVLSRSPRMLERLVRTAAG